MKYAIGIVKRTYNPFSHVFYESKPRVFQVNADDIVKAQKRILRHITNLVEYNTDIYIRFVKKI